MSNFRYKLIVLTVKHKTRFVKPCSKISLFYKDILLFFSKVSVQNLPKSLTFLGRHDTLVW